MASVDPSILDQDESIKPSAKVDLLHSGDNAVPGQAAAAAPLTPPTLPSENTPVPPPPPAPPAPKLEMPNMADLGVPDIGELEPQPKKEVKQPSGTDPGALARPGTILNDIGDVSAAKPPEAQAPKQEFPKPPGRRHTVAIVAVIAVALLATGGGGFAYYWYRQHQAQPSQTSQTPPPPTALSQIQPTDLTQTANNNPVQAGGATNQKSVTLSFQVPSGVHAQQLVPQVEVEGLGKTFANAPTASGQPVNVSGSAQTVSIVVNNIPDGGYHWQASFGQQNQTGPWVAFGNGQTADFTVKTTAPAAPTVASVGGSKFAGANTTTSTTSNQPTISGHADPGTSVTLAVQPDQLTYNATTDSSGNWSITPSAQIPNGTHTLTLSESDNAGNTSQLSFSLAINNPPAQTASSPTTLAPTGDDTRLVNLVAASVFMAALGWLLWARRHGWR